MGRKTLSLLAIALLLGVDAGLAQNLGPGLEPDPDDPNTRVGTRGANFLEIGVGARAQALAGAGAPLQGGVFAMYWNPAAIAGNEGFAVGFAYSALFADLDIDYFYFGGTLPFLGGTIGVNWAGLTSGDIPRTTEAFPAGGDPIFGATFDWTSSFVGGYYARQITDRLQFGGGIKFISEGIDDANADWVAFDAGVTFRTGLLGIELGAAAQNIGNESSFSGSATEQVVQEAQQLFAPASRDVETAFDTRELALPTLFRFAVKVDVVGTPESLLESPTQAHGLDIALDITDAVDSDVQGAIGIEYGYREIAFLRVGKRFFNENQRTGAIQESVDGEATFFRQGDFRDFDHGLAFGGGLRLPVLGRALALDYAYVEQGELDNVQVFSVEFGF